jgi:hypothetical protein
MRKVFLLCAAVVCLSITASAQDSSVSFDASPAAGEPATPAAPASFIPADREPWQLGVGFQYLQFNLLDRNFHNFGYQAGVTRYLSNWFGVEGTAVAGFGHTGSNPSLDAKSFFIGGGPHVVFYSSSHLEPWGHVIAGYERFRFTQESNNLGVNSHAAFLAGAGLDYKIHNGRLYWRVQGDFVGTNVGPTFSKNYSFGTGLVLNF